MKTVYVFLAEGFEEIEALTVVDMLRRDKIPVEMVSIDNSDTVTGAHGIKVYADGHIDDVNLTQAAMLVLPGGAPGTSNLKSCEKLRSMVAEFNDSNRRIAAICAAPTMLGEMGLLNGKNAVCYPGMEDGLVGANVLKDEVVTDGNITTSRGMGCAIAFSIELIRLIDSKTQAYAMKSKIVYRQ